MKRRIDSCRRRDGFEELTSIFLPDVRGCPSCSRGLGRQTCGGGTGTWPQAVPRACGRQDGRHPPRGQGVAMPPAFQPAPGPCWLQPPRRPPRRARRLMEPPEAHTPSQGTDGRVFVWGRDRGSMESALPGRHQAFAGPAKRVHRDAGCRVPEGGWPLGHHERPGPPRQVGWRRRGALWRCVLPGASATVLAHRLGPTPGQETRGDARWGPASEGVLQARELGRDRREALRQRPRAHTPSTRVIAVGLLREATDTRRARRRQAGQGVDLTLASRTEAPPPVWRPGAYLSARARSGQGPGGQRHLTPPTALIIPDGVQLGAGCGRTAASAGPSLRACGGPCNARAVSAIDWGQGGPQALIPPRREGVAWGQGRTAQVRQKGQGVLGQALRQGVRRDGHRMAPWGGRRRPLGHRRLGLPPGPQGPQGQHEGARHRRRAVDHAGATGSGVEVVGSPHVGEQGDRMAWTRRQRSRLRRVLGRVRPPIFTPQGDVSRA
jgi:hypothetical protein